VAVSAGVRVSIGGGAWLSWPMMQASAVQTMSLGEVLGELSIHPTYKGSFRGADIGYCKVYALLGKMGVRDEASALTDDTTVGSVLGNDKLAAPIFLAVELPAAAGALSASCERVPPDGDLPLVRSPCVLAASRGPAAVRMLPLPPRAARPPGARCRRHRASSVILLDFSAAGAGGSAATGAGESRADAPVLAPAVLRGATAAESPPPGHVALRGSVLSRVPAPVPARPPGARCRLHRASSIVLLDFSAAGAGGPAAAGAGASALVPPVCCVPALTCTLWQRRWQLPATVKLSTGPAGQETAFQPHGLKLVCSCVGCRGCRRAFHSSGQCLGRCPPRPPAFNKRQASLRVRARRIRWRHRSEPRRVGLWHPILASPGARAR